MPPVQITSLEQHLVLLAWLNRQFGYEHNRDLLEDMKESDEGFDAEGRSFVYHRLVSRGDAVSISPDALAQYDDNIRNHLHAMNARRSEPITLRYFQHLAALYTEVFLDGYFNRRGLWCRNTPLAGLAKCSSRLSMAHPTRVSVCWWVRVRACKVSPSICL